MSREELVALVAAQAEEIMMLRGDNDRAPAKSGANGLFAVL